MNQPANIQAERLMLDAKKAILQEQHRRFQVMHREGQVDEAMRQLQVTLACAADLLRDSLKILERAVKQHQCSDASQALPSPLKEAPHPDVPESDIANGPFPPTP